MNGLFDKDETEENFVDYNIFIPNLKDKVKVANKDNLEAALIDISVKIFSFINKYTNNYIWQKEQFQLKIRYSNELTFPYLSGKTLIGDCMDDEWFITFLLFEISKQFNNCIISVKDNDGEFLLIEAANYLPKWLEPENCENRVFIFKGKVHIIPYPTTPYELMLFPAGKIFLSRALDIITGPGKTEASEDINNSINNKIQIYPQKIEDDFHYTKCYIPLKVAHLLYHEPQLIAAAINAFYYRGPEGMKACSKMRNFSIDNQVMTTVKFTKTLYAQLASQQFFPPKIYHLPNPNSPNYKSYELGMKLACAFEMLLVDPTYKNLDQDNKNHTRIRYLLSKELVDPAIVENKNFKDDDDSWMNINENELDDFLNEKEEDFKKCLSDNEDFDDMSDMDEEEKKEMKELSKLFGNFSSFIEKESSYRGVNNMENFDDSDDEPFENIFSKKIDINPNIFMKVLQNELGFDINKSELTEENIYSSEEQSEDEDEDEELKPISINKSEFTLPKQLEDIDTHTDTDSNNDNTNEEKKDEMLETYYEVMDHELYKTKLSKDFKREELPPNKKLDKGKMADHENDSNNESETEENDHYKPVQLDLNLVQNLLDSFEAQEGTAGPTTSILKTLGQRLPKRNKDHEIVINPSSTSTPI
ncbi:hypothetical protein PIROE2DRAFT_62123 [Piromyces sp. E2]|nr:hypothetical protein PIROE2DRAFT_62123 [Piromyces sp. E2]|eukprot:OUM62081.1 hypothetical protein PIROE2DRAFT_62123 [Piromyces sp. E2]